MENYPGMLVLMSAPCSQISVDVDVAVKVPPRMFVCGFSADTTVSLVLFQGST